MSIYLPFWVYEGVDLAGSEADLYPGPTEKK